MPNVWAWVLEYILYIGRPCRDRARQTFWMNWRAHLISSTQVSFSWRTYISSTRVLSMVFRLASRSSVVRFFTMSNTYRYPEKKCTIIFQFKPSVADGMFIPDPGSKNSNMREGWKKICCPTFFCSHKYHKTKNYSIFEQVKKKLWANLLRIIELFI